MRPPSGGGVTRRLLVERLRLHGHLKAAVVARENAEVARRLLHEKEGHMTCRTLDGGSLKPTARDQWGGYARVLWILLQERERVAAGDNSATEMPIPIWVALTDPITTSRATEIVLTKFTTTETTVR